MKNQITKWTRELQSLAQAGFIMDRTFSIGSGMNAFGRSRRK